METTTEAQTEAEAEFKRFAAARLPDHLKGTPAPGSVGLEADREASIAKSRTLWNEQLALGFTPVELVGAAKWPGSTVGGGPRRPLASTVPEAACRAAEGVLRQLQERQLDQSFPPQLLVRLEEAARGVYSSDENSLRNAVNTGRTAVSHHDATVVSQRQAEAQLVPVEVFPTSQGAVGFARRWPAGRHMLTTEEVTSLEHWAETLQSDAAKHGHATPQGFQRNWPPFTIGAAAVATVAPGSPVR